MSKHLIQIDIELDDTQLKDRLDKSTSAKDEMIAELETLLEGLRGGAYNGHINTKLACDFASVVGTFTGVPTADDTIDIAGVTLTAKAEPADGSEFDIEGTAAAQATELAAVINANTDLQGIVTASADGAAVTIQAAVPGKMGNGIVVADSLDNFTFADSATALSGGDEDTDKNYGFGRVKEAS